MLQNTYTLKFNLASGTNETRRIEWHKTSKCKCRFNSNVCNNKQGLNDDKCRCECKEFTDKGVCDKGFIWNVINPVILVSIWNTKFVSAKKG